MSHYYGIVSGMAKTRATRRGSAKSGIETIAAGWGGAIRVKVSQRHGEDYFEVEMIPWGTSGGTPRTLAFGFLEIGPAKVATMGQKEGK